MRGQGPRFGGRMVMALPALILAVWLVGLCTVAWEGLGARKSRIRNRLVRLVTGKGRESAPPPVIDVGPVEMLDPRLASLRQAAQKWKPLLSSTRTVVDQVCLVPDMTAFLDAIAFWDDRHFFPILIDEPAWTLPFLRAFRPARIVRYGGRSAGAGAVSKPAHDSAVDDLDAVWSEALAAVSRAWSSPTSAGDTDLADASLPPTALGIIPPGVVISDPEAPMLAGAVALAAGRFQPMVRVRPLEVQRQASASSPPHRFREILTLPEAWNMAMMVERQVASLGRPYDRLGDQCDFLTIASDWPYRYALGLGDQSVRGGFALDDLIGRRLERRARGNWTDQVRARWAFTGRLLGGPAESVAHALGALFLQPTSTLLWNTYRGGQPWSQYTMDRAARDLRPTSAGAEGILMRTAGRADLASWHRTVDPVNRFGLVMINSSGGPDFFQITGGVGRPGDIPRGLPTAVAMIHSFSAADPTDPQTIAWRWIAQGAFSYFGSVNEPFLLSFRTPSVVAELLAAEIPFVAALRQGENETFGIPWRLSYLGDPLYRLEKGARPGRTQPSEWCAKAPAYARWPAAEVVRPEMGPTQRAQKPEFRSDADRLRWCLDAATGALAGPAGGQTNAWQPLLRAVRRDHLDRSLRSSFDELLIDTLGEKGEVDELMTRLAQIPAAERSPGVWQAIETSAMVRLARLNEQAADPRSFERALELWDTVMKMCFPESARFPAHFTERVAATVGFDTHRRALWRDRLERTARAMAAVPAQFTHAATVSAERQRLEGLQRGGGHGP
jgi:hypothetical protein